MYPWMTPILHIYTFDSIVNLKILFKTKRSTIVNMFIESIRSNNTSATVKLTQLVNNIMAPTHAFKICEASVSHNFYGTSRLVVDTKINNTLILYSGKYKIEFVFCIIMNISYLMVNDKQQFFFYYYYRFLKK